MTSKGSTYKRCPKNKKMAIPSPRVGTQETTTRQQLCGERQGDDLAYRLVVPQGLQAGRVLWREEVKDDQLRQNPASRLEQLPWYDIGAAKIEIFSTNDRSPACVKVRGLRIKTLKFIVYC
ncbi:hypothetical protein [Amycolatopsis sacchari]|uniref:hypothetical protein n=1 Tax=Amycolatopsis sacchari TaxID=115433 RepID=UPI003EBB28A1